MFIHKFSIAALALLSAVSCGPSFTKVNEANTVRLKTVYVGNNKMTTCLDFAASVTPEYLLDASGEVKYKSLSVTRTSKRSGGTTSLGTVSELVLLMQGLAFRYCEAAGNEFLDKSDVREMLGRLTTSITQVLLVREGTTLKTAVELRSQYTKEHDAAEEVCAAGQKKRLEDAKSAYDKVCDSTKPTPFAKLTIDESCKKDILTSTACTVLKDQKLEDTGAVCSYLKKKAEECTDAAAIQKKLDELDAKMLKSLDLLLVTPAAGIAVNEVAKSPAMQPEDKKPEDKKSEDKKSEDKKSEDKKSEDKKSEDKKSKDKQAPAAEAIVESTRAATGGAAAH